MNSSRQDLVWSRVSHSPWVRLFAALIGGVGAYLQFKEAGLTLLFWILCGLTTIAALLATVPLVLKWLRERKRQIEMQRLHYDHRQKVKTLTDLIDEFATLEKAKCLADTTTGNVRVVAILPVEGGVGVMLNIGRQEHVQVGTQLLVHRIDHYSSDGQHIKPLLGLVRVTYVQAENNCSQAVVVGRLDPEFWDQATARLRRERRIDPPKNFAVPYVPPELDSLSLEDLAIFRQYLESIHNSLTRTGLDQIVQEENLQ